MARIPCLWCGLCWQAGCRCCRPLLVISPTPQHSSTHVHAMCYLTARSATLAVEGQMMRNFIRCKPDLWSEDIGAL